MPHGVTGNASGREESQPRARGECERTSWAREHRKLEETKRRPRPDSRDVIPRSLPEALRPRRRRGSLEAVCASFDDQLERGED